MEPPFEITAEAVGFLAEIERLLGRFEGLQQPRPTPILRRSLRIRTVQGSVAIEGNALTEDQITAVLDGRRVSGPSRDILEVQNALNAYERLSQWQSTCCRDLLEAHEVLMTGLLKEAGDWRRGKVGVLSGSRVTHVAPPDQLVAGRISDLLRFLESDAQTHPVALAAVVHYELEFIHPFEDGNGRIGRLWHSLILSQYHPLFLHVPIESVIRERQVEYYAVLRACDQSGRSTRFVDFCLSATLDALKWTLAEISPTTVTPFSRLATAREHFGTATFSRKDYCQVFPSLSTATASRDLRKAVDEGLASKSGQRALTRYAFINR